MTQSSFTARTLNVEQFKRPINRSIPVTNIYRNAIDLNRFSNAVARQIVRDYNAIILSAVEELRRIDLGLPTEGAGIVSPASVQAQRLRVILLQIKESLDRWADRNTDVVIQQLQGLAELQTEFAAEQLQIAISGGVAGARDIDPSVVAQQAVRTVEVSPNFAATVATVDPTDLNLVLPGTGRFSLTAAQGTAITLPNGQIIQKAFRGLAESQAQRFNTVIRTGLLTGEATPQIARRLVGTLNFGDLAKTVRQQALAGGELTKMADHQILTLVRTSVQQVANEASQQVYRSNQDVTKKYKYVATLDERTSPICRRLDGQEFEYGKGPYPPVHFNCRSTTVAVIDWEGLDLLPPEAYKEEIGEDSLLFKRAAVGGPVDQDLKYGEWLAKQSAEVKAEVWGSKKVKYFNLLSRKYGPNQAVTRMVREDGSELTLEQLRRRYGPSRS